MLPYIYNFFLSTFVRASHDKLVLFGGNLDLISSYQSENGWYGEVMLSYILFFYELLYERPMTNFWLDLFGRNLD